MSDSFTSKDKILVHLLDYEQSKDDYTQPLEVTQGGMSEQLGLRQNTISYALKKLKESEFLEEKTSRVKGKKQRMKTYYLTEDGVNEAKKKRKEMKESTVDIDVYGEERMVKVKNVDKYVRSEMSVLDTILKQEDGGIKVRVGGEEGAPVLYRSGLPMKETFKDIETDVLEDWYRDKEGTGLLKGHFPYRLGAFTRIFQENTNIFFFKVKEHSAPIDLWDSLSSFLKELGKVNLSNYRDLAEWLNPRTSLKKLKDDLKYSSALLIFDSIDLQPDLKEIILKIARDVSEFQHIRILLATEGDGIKEALEDSMVLDFPEELPIYKKRYLEESEYEDFDKILSREISFETSLALNYLSIFRYPIEKEELKRIGAINDENIQEAIDTPLIIENEEEKITVPDGVRKKKKKMISKEVRKDLDALAAKYFEEKNNLSSREELEKFYHLISSDEIKKAKSWLEELGSEIISNGYSQVLIQLLSKIEEKEDNPLIIFYEAEARRVNREFEKSKKLFETLLDETDEKRWELRAYLSLGKVEEKLGEYDRAIHDLNEAERIAKNIKEKLKRDDELGRIYARRGEIWNKNDDYEKAKEDLKKAIQILVHGEDHHLLTSSYFILARMEKKQGREEQAIEPFKMGLKSWSKLDKSNRDMRGRRKSGMLYKVLKELEDAEIRFRTQFHEERAGPIQTEYEDLKTAALLSLAESHMENESYEKAIKSAKDAKESMLSEDKRERAFTEALLGKAYLETDREIKAEDHLNKAISLYNELGQQYQLGLTYFSLAKVQEKNNDPEALAENYRKAVLSLSKSGAEKKAEKVKREMENIPISM